MLSAAELLATLHERGVELTVQGATLRYRAPAGVLTDADRALLRTYKADLLPLLADSPPTGLWWQAAPWHGRIALADFRAVIAAYVARHGYYAPELPARCPQVLAQWIGGASRRAALNAPPGAATTEGERA